METKALDETRCYELLFSGNYDCPSGCTNSYVLSDNVPRPDYTQNTYRFKARDTRCRNSQNENCDDTVRRNQEYIDFDCGYVGGGGGETGCTGGAQNEGSCLADLTPESCWTLACAAVPRPSSSI